MVTRLPDANVLIALFAGDHVHHAIARNWFVALRGEFATCPVVEGALTRWLVRVCEHDGIRHAQRELTRLALDPRHRFWPDDLPYAQVRPHGVLGHKQVTDAYLAALTRKHKGRLVTLDRGMAALHDDVAELIPT